MAKIYTELKTVKALTRVETAQKIAMLKRNESYNLEDLDGEKWNALETSRYIALSLKTLWLAANRAQLSPIENLLELAFYDAVITAGGQLGTRTKLGSKVAQRLE